VPTSLIPSKWKSVLLILFAVLGMVGLLGRGGFLIWRGLSSTSPTATQTAQDLAGNILDALSMGFCALLLLPVIVYSRRLLRGGTVHPASVRPIRFWQAAVLAAVWLVIAITGTILTNLFHNGWVVLAVFFPLGVALPIVFLAWIGLGGLPTGSVRRLWAVFSLAMAGSTMIALLAEYLVIGAVALVGWAAMLSHPEWRDVVQQLQTQITRATDMQSVLTVLAPYLTNPFVLLLILVFASGVGPFIEEAAKPAAIWLLGKSLRSPSEGFALGVLCGAGFALLEGVTAASGYSQIWGLGMAGRAASSLMHIMASGLVGWGIASARLEKRFLRLAALYLGAVGLHGLWNGSVVLAVYGALRWTFQNGTLDPVSIGFILIGAGLLSLLLPVILIALPLVNRALRRAPASAEPVTGQIDV